MWSKFLEGTFQPDYCPSDLETTKLGYTNEEKFEIFDIDSLTDEDWRKPIVEYLKIQRLWLNEKIKYCVLIYILMGNDLFKKTL